MICFGDGQVGWDESTAGDKQWWVPLCKIEPLAAPFLLCPPIALRSKLDSRVSFPVHAENYSPRTSLKFWSWVMFRTSLVVILFYLNCQFFCC